MSTYRLIKFRSLKDNNDFGHAEDIIKTGKFWCSKLWNLNDPMEGVFSTYEKKDIPYLFDQKNNTVICSFSHHGAIKNPLLWGYYANGSKGIAIEIYIDENEMETDEKIRKIEYSDKDISGTDNKEKIMTRKRTDWSHENEIRFLKTSDENKYKIGKITNVYFGTPYKNVTNYNDIEKNSEKLEEYNKQRDELEKVCKNNGITPKYYYTGKIFDKSDMDKLYNK